jgi:ribosome-binding factor A
VSRRNDRLAEEVREEVARIVGTGLKDPRIGFVTVIRVELTADLRNARVYVGILGGPADRDKTLAGLQQAAGFIRRELGRRIHVRHTPELQFRYDEGLDATARVARLLEEAMPAAPEAAPQAPPQAEDEPDEGTE